MKIKYWLASLLLPVLLTAACTGGSDTTSVSEDSDAPAATTEEVRYVLPETAAFNFDYLNGGTLTVRYPSGWKFLHNRFITSRKDANAIDLQTDINTGMPPGAIFIQVEGNGAGAFGSEDAASYSEAAFDEMAEYEGITFSSLKTVPIAVEGMATVSKQTASKSETYDTAFYILEAEGGEYITLKFFTAPGELDSQQSLIDAMVASVSYTAP